MTNEKCMEFANLCTRLGGDRVIDRREAAKKIKELLESRCVIQYLNENTDDKRSLTWDRVVLGAKTFVVKEGESLQKTAAKNKSATTLSREKNLKMEAGALFKYVVRAGSRHGSARLTVRIIVDHIIQVLQDEFLRDAFGSDYTKLLVKDILPVQKYCSEMPVELWNALISLYGDIMASPYGQLDQVNVVRIVQLVCHHMSVQFSPPSTSRLFDAFASAVSHARNEKNATVLEHILAALNTFCQTVAINARTRLCLLGEKLVSDMLSIWKTSQPHIKEHVIQFVRFQLEVHHPHGVVEESAGAQAADWYQWKRSIQLLYEVILSDLEQVLKDMSWKAPGRSITGQKNGFVKLAAAVFHQMTALTLGDGPEVAVAFGGRRSLEAKWSVWCDMLKNVADHPQAAVSWLQVLSLLLEKHPESISSDEISVLLGIAHVMQKDTKWVEVLHWSMCCLRELAIACKCEVLKHRDEWMSVWSTTVRFISLQKGEEGTAFALLAALLQSKLVEPSVEPWKWLGHCVPSSQAVDFVSSHLNSCAIPENFKAVTEVSHGKQAALFPLRRQLFDWLLPVPREPIGLLNTQGSIGALRQNLSIRVPPLKVAQLLFTLTQRDPRAVANSMKITGSGETEDDSLKWEDFIYSMGQAYLHSAFSRVVTESTVEGNRPVAALGSSVASLQLLLCEQMAELSQLLSEPIETDPTMSAQDRHLAEVERLKFSAYHCSVVVHTVTLLTSAKAISLESMKDSRLMVSLSRLLHFLASRINDSSLQYDSLDQSTEIGLTLLHYLESMLSILMFSNNRSANDEVQFKRLRQIFAELMPAPLLDWLCCVSSGQADKLHSSQSVHVPLSAQSPLLGTAPSQMAETSFIGNSSVADSGSSKFVDCDFTLETHSSTDVPASSMSTAHLPSSSKLRIQAARLLSMLWCLRDEDSTDPNWKALYQFVDRLLSPETLDLSKLPDIQVVVTVCGTLCSSCVKLSLKAIDTVLEALRTVLAQQYHDQQVAVCVLQLLAQLARHFQYPAETVKESEAGETCKLVLEAFCGLLHAGKLGAEARLALVSVVRKFIVVDPKSRWTTLSQSNGSGETLHEILISLLADKEHAVRMKAASVEVLFTKQEADGAAIVPLHRSLQEQMFSVLCESIKNAYALPKDVDEGLKDTEAQNRSASVLFTLVNVAKCSAVCRKMALFQLFNHSLYDGTSITEKALYLLASHLGYSSVRNFLEVHLDFLIFSWLEAKQPLSSYPFKLHSFSSRTEFFQTYRKAALPYALLHPDTQQLEHISGELGCDWVELLRGCLPRCMVFILPVFAKQERIIAETMSQEEREGNQVEQRRTKRAHQILQTKMDVSKILLGEIDNFIVELLLRIHEEQGGESFLARYASASDPEPNPPYYAPHCIKAVLHDLVERDHNVVSLVDLLSCQQDTIQSVLLSLKSHLVNTYDAYEKKRMLMGYGLFVELMTEEMGSGLGGSRAYLVRDVIVTVVDCLKCASKGYKFSGSVAWETMSLCCGILLTVCRAAIQTCPKVLGNHLHLIVSCLTDIATQQQRGGEEAFSLLDALITKSDCPQLRPFIAMLDPFPDLELFAPLRRVYCQIRQSVESLTLEKDIERFLSVDQHCPPEARLEGLRHLKAQLRQQTKEVGQVNRTVVRKLICQLIHLASLSQKTTNVHVQSSLVVSEVADCLGEVGAIDIGSVALSTASDEEENQPYHEALCSFLSEPEYFRPCKVLHLLNTLLTDASVDVVASAAACLKSILATKYGDEFLVVYEERGIDYVHEYLYPFKAAKEELDNPIVTSHDQLFVRHVDQSDLWWPPGSDGQRTHGQWVQDMTTALLQSGGVRDQMLILLQPACQAKVSFAESVFPNLIHNILETKNPVYRNVLSTQIQGFLTKLQTTEETATDRGSRIAKESIKLILDTVNFLRTTDRDETGNLWQNNFWLDVNYLSLAVAAQMCSAYFTSLLYVEIWQDAKKSSRVAYFSTPPSLSLSSSSLDVVSSGGRLLRQDSLLMGSHHGVLLEAYSQIGEPDALQGAAVVCSADSRVRLKIYEQEGQWARALGSYDLQLQGCTAGSKASVVESLKHLGLNHVATTYMHGLWNTDPEAAAAIVEHQYELAWRNCVWNLDVESRSLSSGSGFHHALHSCLHALSNREFGPFQSSLNQARSIVMSDLMSASLESVLGIYPMLGRLQSLIEMKEICRLMRKCGPYDNLASQWKDRLSLARDEFVHIEPVWAVRTSLLQTAVERSHQSSTRSEQRESLMAGLSSHLKSEAEVARQSGCHQVSEQAVFNLKLLCNQLPPDERIALDWMCRMKEAELFWSRGEQTVALRAIASLHNELDQAHSDNAAVNMLYPHVLLLLGNWLAESHSEQPTTVVDKYLEPAANLLSQSVDGSETNTSLMKAYFSLARYADHRYRKIADYMESSVFETKKDIMQQQKDEFEDLKKQGNRPTPLPGSQKYWQRRNTTLRRQIEIDENEIKCLQEDSKSFVLKALKNYSLCFQTGDDYDLHIFRLCSLWMSNNHQKELCELVETEVAKIPSHKFLPLLYQLGARLSSKQQPGVVPEFQLTLSKVIERTCLDHPHHSVFMLMALAHADKDAEYSTDSDSRPAAKRPRLAKQKDDRDEYVIDEDKVSAAKNLMGALRLKQASLVQNMERLAQFYIDLAYMGGDNTKAASSRRSMKEVPRQCLRRVENLKEVAVPTIDIPVDPSCHYDNLVHIAKFGPRFSEAGGVNRPKILSCIGSDGKQRRQLVKGKDDLRQDAVMQQVFTLVNKLLQKETATRRRKLKIRTYKVIPLSQRSGVVEWCEGTQPIGIYLIGDGTENSGGAHQRYEPKDWNSNKCRVKMMEVAAKDSAIKLKGYMAVTEHFHPVFRHFFTESFPDPARWFEQRLAYTRSLATSSIVGYIVGLGDRHPQNILIDKNTAELIHIDFGVAFEQGRALPTPETVPFRLTRDLVDGMGVTGVEGIFRRACEETLVVMRGNLEAVLIILEVLVHDPLYDWSMNPVKALNLQKGSDESNDADTSMATSIAAVSQLSVMSHGGTTLAMNGHVSSHCNNKMAVRVLLRLRQKLEGVEDSVPLSVTGQVNHLIQEAVNPENLCRVYAGWQPWI